MWSFNLFPASYSSVTCLSFLPPSPPLIPSSFLYSYLSSIPFPFINLTLPVSFTLIFHFGLFHSFHCLTITFNPLLFPFLLTFLPFPFLSLSVSSTSIFHFGPFHSLPRPAIAPYPSSSLPSELFFYSLSFHKLCTPRFLLNIFCRQSQNKHPRILYLIKIRENAHHVQFDSISATSRKINPVISSSRERRLGGQHSG